MKSIPTRFGEVTVLDPPAELLQTIRSFLPFGLIRNDPPEDGADYGLVMECGKWQMLSVRQHPVDCPYKQSLHAQATNSLLIARSLASYLKAGFAGLILPCAYVATKQKQPLFESGIAYFAYPSLLGRECQEHPFESAFDGDFGHGFTTMMTAMMRAVRESSLAAGLPLPPPVGLHVGQRRQLGYLDFGFMLMGPQVVCLKTCLYPDHDPAWPMMRETGISTVFHLPCQPAAIESALLPLAKSPGENAAKVLPQPGLLATEQPRPPSA